MEERGYTLTRTFDAPREAVWEAWTTPEHFAVWFGTDDVPMEDVDLDVRPGGEWRGVMIYEGRRINWSGIYIEVVEPEKLVVDLTDGTGAKGEYERYTVTLTDAGDGKTEMTLSQTGGHLTDEEYERAKEGTSAFMDSLEGLLPSIKARHDAM
jgi:uncharacterized protein YndB with AHSA1/START domain